MDIKYDKIWTRPKSKQRVIKSALDSLWPFEPDCSGVLRVVIFKAAFNSFYYHQTQKWKRRNKIRSGVEATMLKLKINHGMAKLQVRRLPKVCLAVACKVIACNIKGWANACVALNPTFGRLF